MLINSLIILNVVFSKDPVVNSWPHAKNQRLINWANNLIILNAVFAKVPNGKQLPSCKKSDQNVEKNQSYETFYRDFRKRL